MILALIAPCSAWAISYWDEMTWDEDTWDYSLPIVTTLPATNIGSTFATLNGVVNPNGEDATYYFEFGEIFSHEYRGPSESAGAGSEEAPASAKITGFESDAPHYFQLVGEIDYEGNIIKSYGGELSFDTHLPQKAIIIAGGDPEGSPDLWYSFENCSDLAYKSLLEQELAGENIYYLSADPDAAGNGVVDAYADIHNLQAALDALAPGAKDLFIYMVDHGGVDPVDGDGIFMMNAGDAPLYADDFHEMLDSTQEKLPGHVVLLYDAGNSGSFIEALDLPPGKTRVVSTGAAPNQNALFVSDGAISFSSFFWSSIRNGYLFNDSYLSAKNQIQAIRGAGQTPWIDANGNGVPNEDMDESIAGEIRIGAGIHINDPPHIEKVHHDIIADSHMANSAASFLFTAEGVADADGVYRVWGVVTPPGGGDGPLNEPITDLPTFDLDPVGDKRYQAVYDNFNGSGAYNVSILAMDNEGFISNIKTTTVNVTVGLQIKYVKADLYGDCGGKSPCLPSVWEAAMVSNVVYPLFILVERGEHGEDLILNSPEEITITGGWNEAFTGKASESTFSSLTIEDGTVVVENVVLE